MLLQDYIGQMLFLEQFLKVARSYHFASSDRCDTARLMPCQLCRQIGAAEHRWPVRAIAVLAVESDACKQALQLRSVAVGRRVLVRCHAVDRGEQSFRWRHGDCAYTAITQ